MDSAVTDRKLLECVWRIETLLFTWQRVGLRQKPQRRVAERSLIVSSGLFDAEYYLAQNPDVAKAGVDTLEHYLKHGGFEGRNPSSAFDSASYLKSYADVQSAGINPLLHYLLFGFSEDRNAGIVGSLPKAVPLNLPQRKSISSLSPGEALATLEAPPAFDLVSRFVEGRTAEKQQLEATCSQLYVVNSGLQRCVAKNDSLLESGARNEELWRTQQEGLAAELTVAKKTLQEVQDARMLELAEFRAQLEQVRSELQAATIATARAVADKEEITKELELTQLRSTSEIEDMKRQLYLSNNAHERCVARNDLLLQQQIDRESAWAEQIATEAVSRAQLSEKLNSQAQTIHQLNTELEATTQLNAAVVRDRDAEIERLSTQIEGVQAKLEIVNRAAANAVARNEQLMLQLQSEAEKSANIDARLLGVEAERDAEVAVLRSQLDAAETDLRLATTAIQDATARNMKLMRELEDVAAESLRKEGLLTQTRDALQEAIRNAAVAEQSLSSNEAELKRREALIASHEAEIERLVMSVSAEVEKVKTGARELADAKDVIEQLRASAAVERDSLTRALDAEKWRGDFADRQLSEAKASLEKANSELNSYKLTASTQQVELVHLEREAERLRLEERRLLQTRAELDDLRVRVAVLDHMAERGRDNEKELLAARAQNAVMADELTKSRLDLERLGVASADLERLSAELTGAKKELENAVLESAAIRERAEAAQRELEDLRATTPSLSTVAADLKASIGSAASADLVASQVADARDRLASRLEVLTAELSELRRAEPRGRNTKNARRLYLDLLEAALTGTLTEDSNMASWGGPSFDPNVRFYGRDWPATAKTMIGTARMRNLRRLVETALSEGVGGDLLEAGVWRGGACIYMRGILAAHGVKDRVVWAADSFAGLPTPDDERYPADRGDPHHTYEQLAVSLEDVKRSFEQFGLLDNQVAFLPGWFQDTLPKAPIKSLALLRLDGDMYGSTMETLEALYSKVNRGGFVVVDDYILPACRQAVDDFRTKRRIKAPLEDVDGAAAFWRKV